MNRIAFGSEARRRRILRDDAAGKTGKRFR
jgi:hypothetical protein